SMSARMPVWARCAPGGPGRRTSEQCPSIQSKRKFHKEFMIRLHTRATVLQLLELVTLVFPLALLAVRGGQGTGGVRWQKKHASTRLRGHHAAPQWHAQRRPTVPAACSRHA